MRRPVTLEGFFRHGAGALQEERSVPLACLQLLVFLKFHFQLQLMPILLQNPKCETCGCTSAPSKSRRSISGSEARQRAILCPVIPDLVHCRLRHVVATRIISYQKRKCWPALPGGLHVVPGSTSSLAPGLNIPTPIAAIDRHSKDHVLFLWPAPGAAKR